MIETFNRYNTCPRRRPPIKQHIIVIIIIISVISIHISIDNTISTMIIIT